MRRENAAPSLPYILRARGSSARARARDEAERDENRRRRGITSAFTRRDDTRPRVNLALITGGISRVLYLENGSLNNLHRLSRCQPDNSRRNIQELGEDI